MVCLCRGRDPVSQLRTLLNTTTFTFSELDCDSSRQREDKLDKAVSGLLLITRGYYFDFILVAYWLPRNWLLINFLNYVSTVTMSSDDDLFGGLSLEPPSTLLDRGGSSTAVERTVESEDEEGKGKREPLFSSSLGSADKLGKFQEDLKSREERKVGFAKPKKSEGKTQAFIYLKDLPGVTICCVGVIRANGLKTFCGEALKLESKTNKLVCRVLSHNENAKFKTVMTLKWPAFYVPDAKPRGRGGICAVPDATSFIMRAEVPDDMLHSFMVETHTKQQAKELMATARQLNKTGGTAADLVARKLDYTEDALKACFTPGKRIKTSPGSTDSVGSWDYVEEDEPLPQFEVNDMANAVESLTQKSASKASPSFIPDLKIVLKDFNKSLGDLREFIKKSDKKSNRSFNKVFDTTNKLALFVSKLESGIGDPRSFAGDEDVTTVYEGIQFLHERLTTLELDMGSSVDKKLLAVKKELERLRGELKLVDVSHGGLVITSDQLKDGLMKVTTSVNDFRKSARAMKTNFLDPLKQMYNSVMTPRDPEQSVLARLARLEKETPPSDTASGKAGMQPEDLFGAGLTGFFDSSGTEMGSAAQYKRLSGACEDMQAENARLRQELNELRSIVSTTVSVPVKEASGFNFGDSDWKRFEQRLVLLELDGKNKRIHIGKFSFSGIADCTRFIRTKMVWDDNSGILPEDFIALLHGSTDMFASTEVEDVVSRDHKTARAGFTNQSSANVYASLQSILPKPLTVNSKSDSVNRFPLPRITKHEYWDKEDGRNGLRWEITQAVESRHRQVGAMYKALLLEPHTDAYYVYQEILAAGLDHWRKIAEFLSTTYKQTNHVCDDNAESWKYACEVVKGLLTECYNVRSDGANRSSMQTFTVEDGARILWGLLRSHSLMEEFSRTLTGSETHPKLASYVLQHLFRNRVTPKQFDDHTGSLAQLKSTVAKLSNKK